MIWLKRISPFVLIAVLLFGFNWYSQRTREQEYAQMDLYAWATARVWLASATYRYDPDSFLAYRDSLIVADSLSLDDLAAYIKLYDEEPEQYVGFAKQVNRYIDSLSKDRLNQLSPDTALSQ